MIERILKQFGYVKLDAGGNIKHDSNNCSALRIEDPYPIDHLSSHQILTLLGFNIPENGLSINPVDVELNIGALKLLGLTINPDRITDEQLIKLREDWHGNIELRFPDLMPQNYSRNELKTEWLPEMRGFIQALLTSVYKFQKGSLDYEIRE